MKINDRERMLLLYGLVTAMTVAYIQKGEKGLSGEDYTDIVRATQFIQNEWEKNPLIPFEEVDTLFSKVFRNKGGEATYLSSYSEKDIELAKLEPLSEYLH